MRREVTPELMDDPNIDRSQLKAALGFIQLVNRWLGGRAALISQLERWSRDWPRGTMVSLLDVATGAADLPIAATQWAARAGFHLKVVGIDLHQGTLDIARENLAGTSGVELQTLDARRLVEHFGATSFDYVHAGLFLHHLQEPEIVDVLRQMRMVARRGVIWNDLFRSRVGEWFIRAATIGRPRVVRHDATVSVRAGFTRAEAMSLAAAAGLQRAEYRLSYLSHRFTVTADGSAVE